MTGMPDVLCVVWFDCSCEGARCKAWGWGFSLETDCEHPVDALLESARTIDPWVFFKGLSWWQSSQCMCGWDVNACWRDWACDICWDIFVERLTSPWVVCADDVRHGKLLSHARLTGGKAEESVWDLAVDVCGNLFDVEIAKSERVAAGFGSDGAIC